MMMNGRPGRSYCARTCGSDCRMYGYEGAEGAGYFTFRYAFDKEMAKRRLHHGGQRLRLR